MSPLCPHKRMQSATRMDCLENLLIKTEVGEETTSVNRSSPRDSLSPLDDRFGDDGNRKGVDVSRTSSASSEYPPPLVASTIKIQLSGQQQLAYQKCRRPQRTNAAESTHNLPRH